MGSVRNEKQAWLHKKIKEFQSQANGLMELIKEEKYYLSKYIKVDGEVSIRSSEHFNNLNRLRRKLKGLEKEIRIVKQLIKETK